MITNEDEFDLAVIEMGQILERNEIDRSEDDHHRLSVLIILIRDYEDIHYPLPKV